MPADCRDAPEQSGTLTVNGLNLLGSTFLSLACNGSAGALDTLNLYWKRADFLVEVYALATCRMA